MLTPIPRIEKSYGKTYENMNLGTLYASANISQTIAKKTN